MGKKDEEIVQVIQESKLNAGSLMEIASKYENRDTNTGARVFMTEAKFDEYNGAANSVQDGRGSLPI